MLLRSTQLQLWPMLSKLLSTISQFLFVTHANQNATAVVALCLAFKLLRPMRTVLPTARIHIAVGNNFGCRLVGECFRG